MAFEVGMPGRRGRKITRMPMALHCFGLLQLVSCVGFGFTHVRSVSAYLQHGVDTLRYSPVQPNALLGARSNVARVSQRGPLMLGAALPSARAMPLALAPAMATKPARTVTRMASTAGETKKGGVDVQLICYFALWYLGNYYCKHSFLSLFLWRPCLPALLCQFSWTCQFIIAATQSEFDQQTSIATSSRTSVNATPIYTIELTVSACAHYSSDNISNKMALTAAGGAAGFPLTIATLQLAVGCVYGLFLWAAPDARALPTTTKDDILKIIPVAFCSAAAHSFSVFALSSGSVSFGQIVKAAEPAFAALLGVTIYKKSISNGKWLCLIPIIGGVVLASVKELDFAWSALITACLANLFAAFKVLYISSTRGVPGLYIAVGLMCAHLMRDKSYTCETVTFRVYFRLWLGTNRARRTKSLCRHPASRSASAP